MPVSSVMVTLPHWILQLKSWLLILLDFDFVIGPFAPIWIRISGWKPRKISTPDKCLYNRQEDIMERITVAPLTFPVQEVSNSSNDITIEMHMHDGTEVGLFMGDNMKWHTSGPSCKCISIVMSLGEVLTSWTGEKSGATVECVSVIQVYSQLLILYVQPRAVVDTLSRQSGQSRKSRLSTCHFTVST